MQKVSILIAAPLLVSIPLHAQGWVNVTPSIVNGNAPAGALVTANEAAMCFDPIRARTCLYYKIGSYFRAYTWDGNDWTQDLNFNLGTAGQVIDAIWDPTTNTSLILFSHGFIYSYDGTSLNYWQNSPQSGTNQRILRDPSSGLLLHFANQTTRYWDAANFVWQSPTFSSGPGPITSPDDSLFIDASTQSITSIAVVSSYAQMWSLSNNNWTQHYPQTLYANLGRVAPAIPRSMSLGLTFDPTYPSPRAWSIDSHEMTELFLTSWPSRREHFLHCYDSARDRFVLHGGIGLPSGIISAETWELDLGPNALFTTYGSGCPNSAGQIPQIAAQTGTLPAVNTQFNIQVSGLPFTGPAFMWLGFSDTSYAGLPLPFNLALLGAPQCSVLMSPDQLYAIPNVLGTSVWTLGIPNIPGFTFYNQVVAFDPAANSLGLVFSNASESIVGQ